MISVLGVEGDKLPVAAVPAAACASPGASKSRAARGRDVFTVVPAVESAPVAALPRASKLRTARGRLLRDVAAVVAADTTVAADRALPGANKCSNS